MASSRNPKNADEVKPTGKGFRGELVWRLAMGSGLWGALLQDTERMVGTGAWGPRRRWCPCSGPGVGGSGYMLGNETTRPGGELGVGAVACRLVRSARTRGCRRASRFGSGWRPESADPKYLAQSVSYSSNLAPNNLADSKTPSPLLLRDGTRHPGRRCRQGVWAHKESGSCPFKGQERPLCLPAGAHSR